MNYLKDKIIIEFLCKIDSLITNLKPKLQPIYYFILGHTWQSYLQTPKALQSILESFSIINQDEKLQIISKSQRDQIFLKILIDPKGDLDKKILDLASKPLEEESKDNQEPTLYKYKEHRIEWIEFYEKVELKIVLNQEEDTKLLPIDLVIWGFFEAYLQAKPSATKADHIFEKILAIRQAEISSILNHNQKMRIFRKLYNNWQEDLNECFAQLKENPSLGSKPLSSLIVPEDKLNQILMQKPRNEGVFCYCCRLNLYDIDEPGYYLDVCGHTYHESCLREGINRQFREQEYPIKCPDECCAAQFTIPDLQKLIKERNVQEIYETALNDFIKKGSMVLNCPRANCPDAFYLESGQFSVDCPVCKQEYCLKCKSNKHEGECRNQTCPACRQWVTKEVGSSMMVCRCGFLFCSQCGKEHRKHNYCDFKNSYPNLRANFIGEMSIEDYLFESRTVKVDEKQRQKNKEGEKGFSETS